jgi:hypothetical protein
MITSDNNFGIGQQVQLPVIIYLQVFVTRR